MTAKRNTYTLAAFLALVMALLLGCATTPQGRVNALTATAAALAATCEASKVATDVASDFNGDDAAMAQAVAAAVGAGACFAKGFVERRLERAQAALDRELTAAEVAREAALDAAQTELTEALEACQTSTPSQSLIDRLAAAKAQCRKLEGTVTP